MMNKIMGLKRIPTVHFKNFFIKIKGIVFQFNLIQRYEFIPIFAQTWSFIFEIHGNTSPFNRKSYLCKQKEDYENHTIYFSAFIDSDDGRMQ